MTLSSSWKKKTLQIILPIKIRKILKVTDIFGRRALLFYGVKLLASKSKSYDFKQRVRIKNMATFSFVNFDYSGKQTLPKKAKLYLFFLILINKQIANVGTNNVLKVLIHIDPSHVVEGFAMDC